MTANQLQYWRNVETERANRAQEQTIPSQIRLNEANVDLASKKAVSEALDAVLKRYEISRQPIVAEKLEAEVKKALSESNKLDKEAQLRAQEYLRNMWDTKIAQYKAEHSDPDFTAGVGLVGDTLRQLFGGLFSGKVSISGNL